MTTKKDLLDKAIEALQAGLNPLPPIQTGEGNARKAPWLDHTGKWDARKKTQMATLDEIESWYSGKSRLTGLGYVCGKISGNLVVIDFDDRSAYSEFKEACQRVGLDKLLENIEYGYFETTPNGAHLYVRVPDEALIGSAKWAKNKEGKARIETKAEGGFIVASPTYGLIEGTGPYVQVVGGPRTIVTISGDEFNELRNVAKSLNQHVSKVPPKSIYGSKAEADDRPGDRFNKDGTWEEVLGCNGAKKVHEDGSGKVTWCRPGKKYGVSATTNYDGTDLLYVFTTNWPPFEPETGYTKFTAYAMLEHDSDFRQAAKTLAESDDYDLETAEPETVQRKATENKEDKEVSLSKELLRPPGLLGQLIDWQLKTARYPQPIFALASAISIMGTILGRKVRTSSDARTNFYINVIGYQGCGKTHPQSCIKKAIHSAYGRDALPMTGSFHSASALTNKLHKTPNLISIIDEVGNELKSIVSSKDGSYRKDLERIIKELYSETGIYMPSNYADDSKNITIDQPCLNIFGAATYKTFSGALTHDNAEDGLLSRLLIFPSKDYATRAHDVDVENDEIPKKLRKGLRYWANASTSPNNDGNLANTQAVPPEPLVVRRAPGAKVMFQKLEEQINRVKISAVETGKEIGSDSRLPLNAWKLAMIRACGQNMKGDPMITFEDMNWGIEVAKWCNGRMDYLVKEYVADSNLEDAMKKVLKAINGHKYRDMPLTLLSRKVINVKKIRVDAINELIAQGKIEKRTITKEGAKKPTTYYRLC